MEKQEIRKVSSVEGMTMVDFLTELGLEELTPIVGQLAPETLIMAARNGELRQFGDIGPVREKQLTEALDRAGFIWHMTDDERHIRDFFWHLYGNPRLEEALTAEHYERRKRPDDELDEFDNLKRFDEAKWTVREMLSEIMGTMTVRERRFLELHFGLNGQRPHLYREISKMEGITSNRVGQVIHRAIERQIYHWPLAGARLKQCFAVLIGVELDFLEQFTDC